MEAAGYQGQCRYNWWGSSLVLDFNVPFRSTFWTGARGRAHQRSSCQAVRPIEQSMAGWWGTRQLTVLDGQMQVR